MRFKSTAAKLAASSLVALVATTNLYQNANAAGNTANSTSNAHSYMLNDITCAVSQHLMFGETYSGKGTTVVNPGDSSSGSGHKQKQPAIFAVTGDAGHQFTFSAPADFNLTTDDNSAATERMAVTSFTSSVASPATLSGTADDVGTTGSLNVPWGATLADPIASQKPGKYTGSFVFTVTYN